MTDRTPTPEQWRDAASAVLRAQYKSNPDLDLVLAMVEELAEASTQAGHLSLTRRLHRRLQRLERRHR